MYEKSSKTDSGQIMIIMSIQMIIVIIIILIIISMIIIIVTILMIQYSGPFWILSDRRNHSRSLLMIKITKINKPTRL